MESIIFIFQKQNKRFAIEKNTNEQTLSKLFSFSKKIKRHMVQPHTVFLAEFNSQFNKGISLKYRLPMDNAHQHNDDRKSSHP
ncbi:hypothetical protein C7G95_07110 [Acinetobacter nosocomialis]|nr:hypothetical protein CVD09_09470 [Acinetobacter seifertii]PSE16277.1 hypothetical protein C7G95_07110 [Acinetobacter nosocomialis]QBF77556.1 hypothetical protein KAN02_05440 [Acinetobacter nosocomialis]